MQTSVKVACRISDNFSYAFFREYAKWRAAGFGMREALNRIRTAHAAGSAPIGYKGRCFF